MKTFVVDFKIVANYAVEVEAKTAAQAEQLAKDIWYADRSAFDINKPGFHCSQEEIKKILVIDFG